VALRINQTAIINLDAFRASAGERAWEERMKMSSFCVVKMYISLPNVSARELSPPQ